MQDSNNTFYVARSEKPLPVEELKFHLHSNFTDVKDQVRELVARGYQIIGYMQGTMMYDLDDRPLPMEGAQLMDLVLSGPMASNLMPKNRWKFGQNLTPKPTQRELNEALAARRIIDPGFLEKMS